MANKNQIKKPVKKAVKTNTCTKKPVAKKVAVKQPTKKVVTVKKEVKKSFWQKLKEFFVL